MLRQKPLVVSLILAGLVASTQADALGLERLNVTTALGQPLVAEVELSIAPGDDVESIRANIASPAVYRAAGVEYQVIVQNIRVQVLRRPNGKPFLRLASSQSINDPYLDVLVEVNSSTGRLVREYVFLLDPPATAVAQIIEPAQPPRPVMPALSAPIPRPVPATPSVPSAPAPAPVAAVIAAPAPAAPTTRVRSTANGSYNVRAGDTLSGIAGRNAQPGVTIEQLMITIQRSNPDAFIGGNINRLRAGASLTLPSSGDAQAIAQNAASNEVRAQAANWRGYVAQVSDSVPSVASDAPSARASGRVSGAVADTGTSAANSDKLKLSQGERSKQPPGTESKVAAAKALEEERSRAAQLERTKQDLEKALSLKSQALADVQAKAQAAGKATPPGAVAVIKAEPPKAAVAVPVAPPPAPAPVAIAKVDPPKPTAAPVAPIPPVVAAPPPAPAVVVVPSPPGVVVVAPTAPVPAEPAVPVAPVVSTPVVAQAPVVPATAAATESGVMDFLTNNPAPAAAAGLGLLALLGAFLWSRNRRQAEPSFHTKMSDPVINTINPDTVFGTSGLGVVKTNDVPVQSQFSRSGMGTIDSGEVDPVAEAEVYIAYGREAQAEEILREALQRDPLRPDVATKLAEISAMQGKRDSFDRLVTDVVAMDRTGEYKQKLIALAATHFPDHPLAAAANLPTASAATGLSFAPAAATVATAAATTAAVNYASFDAPNAPSRASSTGAVPPSPSPVAPSSSGSLDFVLDGLTITKPNAHSAPPVDSSDLVFETLPPMATPSLPNGRKSLEEDLAELEASLKKATKAGQVSDSGLDFNDFSTANPTNLGTVGPSMRPEMLDLSFDAGRQDFVDPTPSILDGQWHDASTKLDLARAYEEMGDREGAREILREVIHDGDGAQIAEAKALLAKLGG